MTTSDLDPKDYRYIVEKPDASFSPARNKAVIQETIDSSERYFKKLHTLLDDQLGERIEAVSAYGCYRFNKGEKSVKDYLGKRIYTELVGERIIEKLKVMETVNRLNNNVKFKNSILL